MRIAQEEIFGPVLSVIPYDDVDDAVRIANDSDYGLAGTVWTGDDAAGLDVARQVRAGTYGVNTYTMDFAAPFGGYKSSGIGREFGPEGLGHYTELKSIYTNRRRRVTEQLNELAYYAVTHHPADARKVFPEATDAEALGLGSCMISERFTVKEAGVLAGAVAGRAPSLGIASAAINHHTRHPVVTAAMGSTLKAITEDSTRCRSAAARPSTGSTSACPSSPRRSCATSSRRCASCGPTATCSSTTARPASGRCSTTCTASRAAARRSASSPSARRRWRSPASCATSSSCTPSSASRRRPARSRRYAAARSSRDATRTPSASGRAWPPCPTASRRTTALRRGVGRLVTYFQAYGDTLVSVNGWDPGAWEKLKTSELFIEASNAGGAIDATASTETLQRLGEMVPDEWLDASAHGRSEDAARTIARELELGCHSVILHGAEPSEIAPMVEAYRAVRPELKRPVATNPGLFA